MRTKPEVLFVDPSVSDLDLIIGELRPGVDVVVLGAQGSAAQQIARALEQRRGLSAVHVIAHGAPGGVSFTAGAWSAATLGDESEDLAEIGRALGADGELRLWSCRTAAGAVGETFVDALAKAVARGRAAVSERRAGAARRRAATGSWRPSRADQTLNRR